MKVDVLILAGARIEGDLREYSAEKHEALIKLNNRPMVEYVIKAVTDAVMTDRVAIVGPEEKIKNSINYELDLIIDSADSLIENIQLGINGLAPHRNVMLICADIPLITGKIIDEFIDICKRQPADLYYPIISREISVNKYPDMKRTYVKLTEGSFTGGNMVIVDPEVLFDTLDWFEKAIIWRKKPLKLSKLLGVKFLFKLLMGNLTLDEIEKRVAEITDCRGRGIIMKHPEIGFDVDKPGDLKIMRKEFI